MHTVRLQTNRPPETFMQYPLYMTVAELSGNLEPCVQIFKQQHRYVQAYMRAGMDCAEFGSWALCVNGLNANPGGCQEHRVQHPL